MAHNEQRHIANTLRSLVAESDFLACEIKVYANGCTDNTVKISQELSLQYHRITLVELEIASKANAWNTAFFENSASILIFADGDVVLEDGAILGLFDTLTDSQGGISLAGCTLWPEFKNITFEQKFVGFLQLPLYQDFLSGGLYAVVRNELMSLFQHNGINSLPVGLVGEDTFLEKITPRKQFTVIPQKVYYKPPVLKEYWRYLARLRWQARQIALILEPSSGDHAREVSSFKKFFHKVKSNKNVLRLLLGLFVVTLRYFIILINRRKISKNLANMGEVTLHGAEMLSMHTRSHSAK